VEENKPFISLAKERQTVDHHVIYQMAILLVLTKELAFPT
jgi:hypothetical protein